MRCKNFTSSWGGSRYLPNAFTEQGIYMLMTVLKGELAIPYGIIQCSSDLSKNPSDLAVGNIKSAGMIDDVRIVCIIKVYE